MLKSRWLTVFGICVVALVVVSNLEEGARIGNSSGRLVAIGLVVYVIAALTFLLWMRASRTATVSLLFAMGAAAVAIHEGNPTGPVVGLYLVMAFAPLRLDEGAALSVGIASALAFDVHLAAGDVTDEPLVFILVVDVGAAFFFFLGTLLRGEAEQRARADRLVAELEASREREKAAAVLSERSRLARELHDVLAHTLSGLVLQLEGAKLLARGQSSDRKLIDAIERAHTLARDGILEARQAIEALRGEAVPGPERIADLVEEHRRATTSHCELTIEGEPVRLSAESSVALYRTAQEALSNVRKHATAAEVQVRMTWEQDRARLVIDSSDGSSYETPSGSGYGLTGMSERAQLAGGSLLAGPTDRGFRVELTVPTARGTE